MMPELVGRVGTCSLIDSLLDEYVCSHKCGRTAYTILRLLFIVQSFRASDVVCSELICKVWEGAATIVPSDPRTLAFV